MRCKKAAEPSNFFGPKKSSARSREGFLASATKTFLFDRRRSGRRALSGGGELEERPCCWCGCCSEKQFRPPSLPWGRVRICHHCFPHSSSSNPHRRVPPETTVENRRAWLAGCFCCCCCRGSGVRLSPCCCCDRSTVLFSGRLVLESSSWSSSRALAVTCYGDVAVVGAVVGCCLLDSSSITTTTTGTGISRMQCIF